MTQEKRVLLVGLDPAVVDYGKRPRLTPKKRAAGSQADLRRFSDLGYGAEVCHVDHGETAEATVTTKLSETAFDCVLIGAGVRTDPDEFRLFETLVNVAHRMAPQARIAFNTSPTDSLDAVRRWA